MQILKQTGIFFIFLLIVVAGSGWAGVPGQISFQGQLTDLSGTPVADGTYTLRFFLFTDAVGGSQVWNDPIGEEQAVLVVNGIYNVQLGAVHALSPAVFAGEDVWLEVRVYHAGSSTWETLSPRHKITAVAYALRAGDADSLGDQTLADLDHRYVKPGDADVVTSGMIASGAVGSSDVADNSLTAGDLAGGSVGTSEVSDNSLTFEDILDGASSKLDADFLDGLDSSSFFILNQSETVTGRPYFFGGTSGSTPPFSVDSTFLVTNLNADYLDGHSSSYFMPSATDNWVNVTGDTMTASTNGKVLQVDNNQITGDGYAIYARTDAETGYAIAGFAMNTGDVLNRGGHFYAYGDKGQAVYGLAPDTGTGTNYGAYFEARSASGKGVYGKSGGTSGRGVEGSATNSGSYTNYGGYFTAAGAYGHAVEARATNTGDYTNYGVRAQADGTYGIGVYGYSPDYYGLYGYGGARGVYGYATGTYGYGGYFYSSGTTGYGVYAYTAGSGSGLHGYSVGGDGIYAATSASNEHGGYFNNSYSVGLDGAALYARAYNTTADGVAFWAHNDHTISTDATAVLSNDGSGPLLKGFGGNGGEDEFRINNDGTMIFYNSSHETTLIIDPEEGSGGVGGQITLYDGDGTPTIEIDGDYNGDGRITTQELQITGGSDLSEQFDVKPVDVEVGPGMVVSIDPDNPGDLQVCRKPYDNRVAGIISGANGIKTGMMMGQKGTEADGKHPVALTGRVYCRANASNGPIRPGDLLTTSPVPGHAMKATDRDRAFGATIGKAMTSLEQGSGLVLVLVSLQ